MFFPLRDMAVKIFPIWDTFLSETGFLLNPRYGNNFASFLIVNSCLLLLIRLATDFVAMAQFFGTLDLKSGFLHSARHETVIVTFALDTHVYAFLAYAILCFLLTSLALV